MFSGFKGAPNLSIFNNFKIPSVTTSLSILNVVVPHKDATPLIMLGIAQYIHLCRYISQLNTCESNVCSELGPLVTER